MKLEGNTVLITRGSGLSKVLKLMSRVAPDFILKQLSKSVAARGYLGGRTVDDFQLYKQKVPQLN